MPDLRLSSQLAAAWLLLLLATLLALPARAVVGTHDNVPAATLLLPHFEVDLDNPNGQTTLFTIGNASATAALANVTLWSSDSVAVLNFPVYLTGYDLQAINLRDVIGSGVLPRTASDGQDPTDTISPQGALSQDVNFASCTGVLPLPDLSAAQQADLRAALTGQPIPGQGNQCASPNLGDNIARGYVTIDATFRCTTLTPDDFGYFTNVASQQNVLYGDFQLIHPAQNFAHGETLVAIEAGASALVTTPGNYTFYGRYVNAQATDRREPLGTRWAVPRVTEATGGGRVVVWRDNKRTVLPYACGGSGSNALNITAGSVLDRDPLGNQTATATAGSVAPRSSQNLALGLGAGSGSQIQSSSKAGWFELDLNHTLASGNLFGNNAQSYAYSIGGSYAGSQGRFSVSSPPLRLGTVQNPAANGGEQ